MRIVQAEYAVTAVSPRQYPESTEPEISLVGRSNVGKSSLINKMCNRKNMARTSSQPGKTRTVNFYRINQAWYLVDLPGYGFARVSKETKSEWGKFIEEYLNNRQQLAGIIQIVDIRHPPSEDDITMHRYLEGRGLPYCVVATKADKVSRGLWFKHTKIIKDKLEVKPGIPVVVFSGETGEGREQLEAWFEKLV